MNDQEAIQGHWISVPPSQPGFRIPIGPKLIGAKLRYRLQPDSSPRRIYLEHRDAGNRTRSSAHGIYELSGDRLTIRWTFADEPPPEFVSTPDAAGSVLHLQRVD